MKVELTKEEIELIRQALDHAIQDVDDYLETPGFEETYGGLPKLAKEYKRLPDQWSALNNKLYGALRYSEGEG